MTQNQPPMFVRISRCQSGACDDKTTSTTICLQKQWSSRREQNVCWAEIHAATHNVASPRRQMSVEATLVWARSWCTSPRGKWKRNCISEMAADIRRRRKLISEHLCGANPDLWIDRLSWPVLQPARSCGFFTVTEDHLFSRSTSGAKLPYTTCYLRYVKLPFAACHKYITENAVVVFCRANKCF